MKYLLQQMLAFWVIILTVLIIVGVAFTQFTKNAVLNTTYEQMESYADAIQLNSLEHPEELFSNIKLTERALKNQQIVFMAIDEKQEVQYPASVKGTLPNFIDADDWEQLKSGSGVTLTKTLEAPSRDGNKAVMSAIVLKPLFVTNGSETNFFGSLVVLQPIEYMENSIHDLTSNLFKAFLISSVIALMFSYIFAKFQVNRINRMKKATREIAAGNFDVNIENKGKDELAELADDFNTMASSLKASQQEIERQEDQRRQFMADAAHEMRTPLTTINGLLEGIAYEAIPKDQEEKCIALMRNETTRLIRLVNENLDYEKIRSNQINLHIQRFDGTEVAKQVVEQLKNKAIDSKNELRVISTDAVEVTADYDRFVQVLVNIVQNALQFTTEGQVTIELEALTESVMIRISDTGIGMTQEEMKNIWERYYKADPSRRHTKYGESGLGLAIGQQIVKLHQGEVSVVSELGQGTTFNIEFPILPTTEVLSSKKR